MTHKKKIQAETEYAIQIKRAGKYTDYSVYNRRTCRWGNPIEDWATKIVNGYEYKRCCEKHRSTRLVKRITTEEIIFKGGAK